MLRRIPQFSSNSSTATAAVSVFTTTQSQGDCCGGSLVLPSSSTTTISGCTAVVSSTPILSESHRFLRVAKSPFGYYKRRRGQSANHWPLYRRPFYSEPASARIRPIFHWRQFAPHDPNHFLPKSNYVTGDWNGLFCIPLDQVYTLHHCTANVPMRVKRFPTTFEFKNHSRWMIGKGVRTWVENKAHIFDEAALTKRARLELVKEGLLPPG